MWVTTDYKGNRKIWYEQELIEKIRKIALKECLTCGECKNGFKFEQCGYNDILELIENERKEDENRNTRTI